MGELELEAQDLGEGSGGDRGTQLGAGKFRGIACPEASVRRDQRGFSLSLHPCCVLKMWTSCQVLGWMTAMWALATSSQSRTSALCSHTVL